jgi:hypothetical protein
MTIPYLPLDLWYEVFGLLNIDEAIAVSKASPRLFGAFIESKQGIRFRNAINTYMRSSAVDLPVGSLSSFICSVMRNSSLEFSGLISWLAIQLHPVLSSSIVVNTQLFADLSSTIALKDRGFVSVSSSVNDSTVEMKAEDGNPSTVSWVLLYRSSLSGHRVADYHQACDGMGKCVVVVKAENGRIAAAYNEDGFTSVEGQTRNLNGFIACVADDGGCGEIFHRNRSQSGISNYLYYHPCFAGDLSILGEYSTSNLGVRYGTAQGATYAQLFGQSKFRVADYEVFKIVII